ncbi:MAG: hypothetical protein Q7S92_02185 [Candidatus Diapherotrites archaeon]|nr:hypothetical protein [Candidatus Diapherotrites archaeon]
MKRPVMQVHMHKPVGKAKPERTGNPSASRSVRSPVAGTTERKVSKESSPFDEVLKDLGRQAEIGKRFTVDERKMLFFEHRFQGTYGFAMRKDRRAIGLLERIVDGGTQISKAEQLIAKRLLREQFDIDRKIPAEEFGRD